MMSLFVDRRDAMFALMHAHGITPPHGHALSLLQSGPRRMRDLADHMTCDASYITAIIDRLEEAGLVERQALPTDRRVKEIALTAAGSALSAGINEIMTSPPAAFDRVSAGERAELAALLTKVVPEIDPAADPFKFPARR